jgi:hypothetical protein
MGLELHIDDFWPSPLADEAVRRFEARWTDDIVARRTPGPGADRRQAFWALKADFKHAWNRDDLKSAAGLGLVLHQAQAINDANREHLAEALLAQHRFAEALQVLEGSAADGHDHRLLLARALGGLGALETARDRLREAKARLKPVAEAGVGDAIREISLQRSRLDVALGSLHARYDARLHLRDGRPDLAAERLNAFHGRRLELLDALITAASPPAADGWAGLHDQIVSLRLLGLSDRAADQLLRGLEDTPPASPEEVASALRLLRAASVDLAEDRLGGVLDAARRLFTGGADGGFIDLGGEVLSGRAPWTVLMAAPTPMLETQALVATLLARAGRAEAAVALFGALVQGRKDRQALRRELVFCSGLETSGRIRLEPRPRAGPRRIFDLFPYNGELEKLKVKLHEMAPWVDRFVIVEAAETFSGRPKPIHLPGQSAEIAAFLPKIIHVVVPRFPEHAASAWAREYHQRDEAVAALKDIAAPGDLVLLSDADEIVDRRCLEGFEGEFALLAQDLYRYFFNYRWSESARHPGKLVMTTAAHLKDLSPSVARALLIETLGRNRIERAGWHFTSVGDVAAITHKLSSYAHQENDRPDNAERYAAMLAEIRAGRLEPGWERCGIEELPAYIGENRERLAELIL